MGIKKLDDFNHDVEVTKEVLSSMPINNAKNLALYKTKVSELVKEYGGYREQLYNEIYKRSNKYFNYGESARLKTVKKELLDYKDINLFNPINTAYEKLGFDTLLYSLIHYYKNDLASVNEDIKEVFKRFSDAGVELTADDFIYSNYARSYIKEFLKDDDLERMKDVFEDLHWKCPDVISHIETSFRILFNKNIKAFDKYIEDKKKEIVIDNLSYDDYVLKRNNLGKEQFELENYDESVLVTKFMDGEYLLNDYSIVNLSKCYSRFLGDNADVNKGKAKIEDFKTLYHGLIEYKNYLKFSYVIDDVKAKFAERTSHQGEIATLTKDINNIVNDLVRLTDEINNGSSKGFLFFKKKVDIEKNYLDIDAKIKELDTKFSDYDKALIFEKMNSELSETSSIYDVFNFALSFKGYLRYCLKQNEEDIDINKVKKLVKEFETFLYDPYLNILRNINFNTETDLGVIIMDHYKLLEIGLNPDDLTSDGIDDYLKSLIVIINSYYIEKYDMDMEFINNLFEAKKIIEANK